MVTVQWMIQYVYLGCLLNYYGNKTRVVTWLQGGSLCT